MTGRVFSKKKVSDGGVGVTYNGGKWIFRVFTEIWLPTQKSWIQML